MGKCNQCIEEVSLEKNKISSHGAKLIAQGLTDNKSVKTLNLLQQAVKSFGDDCLDAFVIMYATNITLTKLTWRLDSRKSFMLAKLQTRNIEIQKRIANGKDYNDLLPDAMKMERPPEEPERRASVQQVEEHVEDLAGKLPEQA